MDRSCLLFLLPVGLAVALASCKVYDESLLIDDGFGGAGGTAPVGNGVGWWSGKDTQTSCYSAKAPSSDDRPSATDGESVPPIVFALRSMRLGSLDTDGKLNETAWQHIGFDLDATCTRSPTCEQIDPIVSCKANSITVPADGFYCRDNMFGRMEYAIATSEDIGVRFGLNDHAFNCALCQGAYNMMFKISEYNGEPNDPLVRVDIYPSPGLKTLKSLDCETTIEWTESQCWAKADAWMIQSDYVTEPIGSANVGQSKLKDPAAYVRDNYAVVSLPENTRFWFPGDRAEATAFPVVLHGGLVTGRLEKDEQGAWTLTDGIISGRMDVQDAIDGFRLIGMCPGDVLADTVISFANTFADTLTNGEVLPEVKCDALSVGIAFTAAEATLGEVAAVTVEDPCTAKADAGVDGSPDGG
jgi:hypothetical protein